MTDDFVTTLRLQLREAAEREARRGPLRRALPQPRPLALAGALAAAAVAVLIAVGALSTSSPPPATTAPHVVARLAIASQGGALSVAYGSIWTYDPSGDVLRLSPDGDVAARIPIGREILDGAAGTGGMWALTEDRLYRIDPRTNRIVARIPLPPPSRSHTTVDPYDSAVWVGNPGSAIQVDLRTNRLARRISFERNGQDPRGFSGEPGLWYMLRRDGLLETLDARTGRRLGLARPASEGLPVAAASGTVLLQDGAGLAAVDANTGALRWRTNLGTSRVNGAIVGDRALWVQGTPVSGRDQLWELDPRTGRVVAALALPDFGAAGMATTHHRLWIMSPSGLLTGIR
jgi:hypothetical protein